MFQTELCFTHPVSKNCKIHYTKLTQDIIHTIKHDIKFFKSSVFLDHPQYGHDFCNFSLILCLYKIIETVAMVINSLERQGSQHASIRV